MMTPNEKIIMFMKEQNKVILSYNKKLKFFTSKDKKEILKWTKEDADRVWEYIKTGKHDSGLDAALPFCYYSRIYFFGSFGNFCDICEYGKRHKKCWEDLSTHSSICKFWVTIHDDLQKKFPEKDIDKCKYSSLMFSKKFYNDLIKSIEKESKIK